MGENRIKAFYGKCYDERENPDSKHGQSNVPQRSNTQSLIQNPQRDRTQVITGVCEYPLCKVIYNVQQLLTPKQLWNILYYIQMCSIFRPCNLQYFTLQSNSIVKRIIYETNYSFICSLFSHALQACVYPQALWNFRCVLLYTKCVFLCRLWSPATGIPVTVCMLANCLQGFF